MWQVCSQFSQIYFQNYYIYNLERIYFIIIIFLVVSTENIF